MDFGLPPIPNEHNDGPVTPLVTAQEVWDALFEFHARHKAWARAYVDRLSSEPEESLENYRALYIANQHQVIDMVVEEFQVICAAQGLEQLSNPEPSEVIARAERAEAEQSAAALDSAMNALDGEDALDNDALKRLAALLAQGMRGA